MSQRMRPTKPRWWRRKSNKTKQFRRQQRHGLTDTHQLEPLEPRILLTTLTGGDIFEFRQADPDDPTAEGVMVRIVVSGDGIVEIIGANVTSFNDASLGDIPGRIYGSDSLVGSSYVGGHDILGGVGGADGVEPVTLNNFLGALTPIEDPSPFAFNFFTGDDGSDQINLQALASMGVAGNGATYAFNVGSVEIGDGTRQLIQLVQLDIVDVDNDVQAEGTVKALVHQATLSEDVAALLSGDDLDGVEAVAIDPTTGNLYVVADATLFRVNRFGGEVTTVGPIGEDGGPAADNIFAMSFNADGDLYIIAGDFDGDPFADGSGVGIPGEDADGLPIETFSDTDAALIEIDKATGLFDLADVQPIVIDLGFGLGEIVANYTALVIDDDDTFYAAALVIDGDGNQLSVLHELEPAGGGLIAGFTTALATATGAVTVGDDVTRVIDGLALAVNSEDETILVGLDPITQEDGPQLLEINRLTGTAVPMGEPGTALFAFGLTSFIEPGTTRPLLYTVDLFGTELVRGSAVSLPVAADTGASVVSALLAADFSPADGLLYFTARSPITIGDVAVDRDFLYTIDVGLGNRSAIQNSLTRFDGSFGAVFLEDDDDPTPRAITTIVFDQTTPDSATLYAYDSTAGELLDAFFFPGLFFPIGLVDITFEGEAVTGITGMALVNDDPTDWDPTLYAVNGTDLVSIDIATGFVDVLGPLPDPDHQELRDLTESGGPVRGNNIQGLTYNPVLPNPFTGEIGVLIGTDIDSDEAVFIDARTRRPAATIFQILISHSSPNTSIAIGEVPDFDPDDPDAERLMTPFNGSAGTIRVIPAQDVDDPFIIISAPGGTGQVYIGAKTRDLDEDDEFDDLLPITEALLTTNVGLRSADADDLADSPNNVSAGIFVAPNLLQFVNPSISDLRNRLLTQNLDDVQGLAIALDGTIALVDNDRIDEDGNSISSSELAFVISRQLGLAGTPLSIETAGTGLPISNVQGLDYGDVLLDGGQELFAILDVPDFLPSVSVSLPDLGVDLNVLDLTVTPFGAIFVLDDVNLDGSRIDLVQIDLSAAGIVTDVNRLGRIVTTAPGGLVLVTDSLTIESHPLTGQLVIVARRPPEGVQIVGDQMLFAVNDAGFDQDFDGIDDVIATPIGLLGVPDDPHLFPAIAFSRDGSTLHGVRRSGGEDRLGSIDFATGLFTDTGAIVVGVDDVVVGSMDVDRDDNLIVTDRGAGAGTGRAVLVDQVDPDESIELTVPSSIAATRVGFGSNSAGLFYSVDLDGVAFEDLLVSPGVSPTLGTLTVIPGIGFDPSTAAAFTVIGAFIDTASLVQITAVNAMMFSPGASPLPTSPTGPGVQGLFIIDSTNTLYEVDPLTGEFDSTTGVPVVDAASGAIIQVGSGDFGPGGLLRIHDRGTGRLLDLNLFTGDAGGVLATPDDSLRRTVGAIEYDPVEDELLAVDNATGQLQLQSEAGSNESAALMRVGTTADRQFINELLIGGTITGRVWTGAVDTFLAGWVITGTTQGEFFDAGFSTPNNFQIDGDLRNLIVASSIGTDTDDGSGEPQYVTGFDMNVAGKLGQLVALDSVIGQFNVENDDGVPLITSAIAFVDELEVKVNQGDENDEFEEYFRAAAGTFANDSFFTPQYLGTINQADPLLPQVIRVFGTLNATDDVNDNVDYYAVALMGGQTVTVELSSEQFGFFPTMNVGVFDQEQRLIATDYSDIDPFEVWNQPFTFTADEPGVYRIAVAWDGDSDFDGAGGLGFLADIDYTLSIDGVGDLALGAMVVSGQLFNPMFSTPTVVIERGDLGVLAIGGRFYSAGFSDVVVLGNDLRVIEAGEIGALAGGTVFTWGISIEVADGNLGLIGSGGEADLFDIHVAGYAQVIDAASLLFIDFSADMGLGVLRAGSMATVFPSIISVNADGIGGDGIIDLIDVAGDFGVNGPGGPHISTGEGGNVRYLRVTGNVYQDFFFSIGFPSELEYEPGESATIIDDSGGKITISPVGQDDASPGAVQASLTIQTYGIRGSAGSAVVSVTSTDGVRITGDSLKNDTPVEITTINVLGSGTAVGDFDVDDDDDDDADGTTLRVIIGHTKNGGVFDDVDVFEIIGGDFTSIRNTTGGEIVNITASSIRLLSSSGTLGLAKSHSNTAVNQRAVVADVYPFQDQHIGIVTSGNVDRVRSHRGLGNFFIGGQLNDLAADIADGGAETERPLADVFQGIVAPVYAVGDIFRVQIGDGITSTGNGGVAHSGLFSSAIIHNVRNRGLGSDVWGNIVASFGIESIVLAGGGAIINANIMVVADLTTSREFSAGVVLSGPLGNIRLSGPGGIIGSHFLANEIGNVTISKGFGLFNSLFSVAGSAVMGNFKVDGFGIRDVWFSGGGSLGNIDATGKGETLSTFDYTLSVRQSEYLPAEANRLNDIATLLVSSAVPTTAGVIEFVLAEGSFNLGQVSAYQIRDTVLRFANSTKGVRTDDIIDHFELTTGTLGRFVPGADVSALDLTAAGFVKLMKFLGNLDEDSTIEIMGPNAEMKKFIVFGDMDASLTVNGRGGTIEIFGDLTGNIRLDASQSLKPDAFDKIILHGSLDDGSLELIGNGKLLEFAKNVGTAGHSLFVGGNLDKFKGGTDKSHDGANMALDLTVLGDLKSYEMTGMVTGKTVIMGDTRSYKVTADVATAGGDIVTNDVTIFGALKKAVVVGGNVGVDGEDHEFLVALGIGSFEIIDGDLSVDATVSTMYGDIDKFRIRGGDLNGTLLADNGQIASVQILGSDMGGDALIRAMSLGKLVLGGSMLDGAQVSITGLLKLVDIGGSVENGASIEAGTAVRIGIDGDLDGDIDVASEPGKAVQVTIGDDLSGTLFIDGDAKIVIKDNIHASGMVHVTGDAQKLTVTDTIRGQVLIDGSGLDISASSIDGGTLTAGFNFTKIKIGSSIADAVIQAGIRAGDGIFNNGDAGEQSWLGYIGSFTAGTVTNSLIAAGGAFSSFAASTVTNSSVISGFVFGASALADVISGAVDLTDGLADAADRADLLGRADGTLFHGEFAKVKISGASLLNSDLVAGVGAGPDGTYGTADDFVLQPGGQLSQGGGFSAFGSVTTGSDAASNILADSGIRSSKITGGANINANVDYTLADLGFAGGAALAGAEGTTFEITGTGAIINVYDLIPGDGIIDTVTIKGVGNSKVTITAPAGGVTINRILTVDDAQLKEIAFEGGLTTLAGDGIASTPDLWIDAPDAKFVFRNDGDVPNIALGAGFTGLIAGDASRVDIDTYAGGLLRITGSVDTFNLGTSSGDPMSFDLGTLPGGTNLTQIATDSTGTTVGFNAASGMLDTFNVDTGVVATSVDVTDAFTGAAVVPVMMDFNLADSLQAIAMVNNVSPTQGVGALANAGEGLMLSGLAVNAAGEIFTVDSSLLTDRLMKINADGSIQPVGELRDVFDNTFSSNVEQLFFDDDGNLRAILNDKDGDGGAHIPGDGHAIARIQTTANSVGAVLVSSPSSTILPPALLDGGGVLNEFRGAAATSTGAILAVQRNLLDTADELVVIDKDTAVITVLGSILLDTDGDSIGDAATNILGIGFAANGNVAALNFNGVANEMIGIAAADLADPSDFFRLSAAGSLGVGLDAFAMGSSGAVFQSYAYDMDDLSVDGIVQGGRLFTGSTVAVATLGTIDLATGQFLQIRQLDQADGATTAVIRTAAVDTTGAFGGDIFAVTEEQTPRIVRYDAGGVLVNLTDGAALTGAAGEVQSAALVNDFTDMVASVSAVEFDGTVLIGISDTLNQLVTITPTTGAFSARTEPGSVPGASNNLSYDSLKDRMFSLNAAGNTVTEFFGTDQDALRGIEATSFAKKLNITDPGGFSGRIAALGNSFGAVEAVGGFDGLLTTNGTIKSFEVVDGDFGGTVSARRIEKVTIDNGDVLAGSVLTADRYLGSYRQTSSNGVSFDGSIYAGMVAKVDIVGPAGPDALLYVAGNASTVRFGDTFGGRMNLGSVSRSLEIRGEFTGTGRVDIWGNAGKVNFANGTATGSRLTVGGAGVTLNVGRTHSGQASYGFGLRTAGFDSTDGGMLVVGRDGRSLTVRNNADRSVFVYGVDIGPDMLLGTSDDVNNGGSLAAANFRNYNSSVTIAGVLTNPDLGPFVPGVSDNRLYIGDPTSNDMARVDSASAGGVLGSMIGRIRIRNDILNTGGQIAVAAAADGFGQIDIGPNAFNALSTRTYSDPFGAPTVVSARVATNNEIEIVFSEQVLSSSLTIAIDANNDGDLLDPVDTPGSIVLVDGDGNIVDDIDDLQYSVVNDGGGLSHTVLRLRRDGGYPDTLTLSILGEVDGPAVLDRSGLQSALRQFAGDIPGTILDGDEDGIEGGNNVQILSIGDSDTTFLDALASPRLPLEVGPGEVDTLQLVNELSTPGEVAIFAFDADQYEFFSVTLSGQPFAPFMDMALFYQDTQGTATTADDTFEIVAKWESSGPFGQTQAFELPETGTYFVGLIAFGASAPSYVLNMTLAANDDLLDGVLNGFTGHEASGRDIAYVSNTLGENSNELGFNDPIQLVYLNFEGGVTDPDQFYDRSDVFLPFDPSEIKPGIFLPSDADVMINGNGGSVTGIVENILTIYGTTPEVFRNDPLGVIQGQLNVLQVVSFAEFNAESDGLIFTLIDPDSVAFGAPVGGVEFTEVFIGGNSTVGGLGLAGEIDPANMNKTIQAVVISSSFDGVPTFGTVEAQMHQMSIALANVIAHELAHTIGLNHTARALVVDDPDNDITTENDPVIDYDQPLLPEPTLFDIVNFIAAGPSHTANDLLTLQQLGTSPVSPFEFDLGVEDGVDLLLRWLNIV